MSDYVLSHEATLAAIEADDPPIEPGQVWSIRSDDPRCARFGGVARADRVLGFHPDPAPDGGRYVIYEPAKVPMSIRGDGIGRIPEYNLRRIFRLDAELSP